MSLGFQAHNHNRNLSMPEIVKSCLNPTKSTACKLRDRAEQAFYPSPDTRIWAWINLMNSNLEGDAIFMGRCSSVQYRYYPSLRRTSLALDTTHNGVNVRHAPNFISILRQI